MLKQTVFFICITFLLNAECIPNQSKNQTQARLQNIIACLEAKKGIPHSSKSKKGIDCSSLVRKCYRQVGIELPRDSRSQFSVGRSIEKTKAKVGDLIFFKGSNLKSKKVGHSGIITNIREDKIYFIHSTLSKGVIESNLTESYYSKRFIGIKRIIE